jgi:hypothetical protein
VRQVLARLCAKRHAGGDRLDFRHHEFGHGELGGSGDFLNESVL